MKFNVAKDSTQLSQFIVLLVFSPFGIAITCLRLFAVRRSKRGFGAEDWLAVLATLFSLLTTAGSLAAVGIRNGREIEVQYLESLSDYKNMRIWDMVALYSYFSHTLAVKLSVLAFYRRIFGVKPIYKMCIYAIGSLQAMLWAAFCIFQALQCRPWGKFFDIAIPGTCTSEGLFILSGEAPNSFIDFAMILLAMFMIRQLQLSPRVKWKLRFLFGLGFLVGVIGFIKIAITYSTTPIYAFAMVSLWTCVQMFVSLCCSSLPVIYPVLSRTAGWNRFVSRVTNYAAHVRIPRGRARSAENHVPLHHQQDDNSTKGLVWHGAMLQPKVYDMSDLPSQERDSH